jgi:2-phospho-L-lactate/phosphoenolpyruvate guanylyltransferase
MPADRGYAIVPAKGLIDGKSRLAAHLEPEARYAFNLCNIERTLRAAAEFFGPNYCIFVSPCPLACATSRRMGIRALFQERRDGLNAGLALARDHLRAQRARRLTILPVDLPYISMAALHAALGSSIRPRHAAIVPDTCLQGTNLLSVPADLPFQFSFGPSSFDLHLIQLRRGSLDVHVGLSSSLREDIDTIDQLDRFQHCARMAIA